MVSNRACQVAFFQGLQRGARTTNIEHGGVTSSGQTSRVAVLTQIIAYVVLQAAGRSEQSFESALPSTPTSGLVNIYIVETTLGTRHLALLPAVEVLLNRPDHLISHLRSFFEPWLEVLLDLLELLAVPGSKNLSAFIPRYKVGHSVGQSSAELCVAC